MNLSLAERATCPRCGPRFGLILLADEVRDRRVQQGVLGCPNCRTRYPVREGVGDLRSQPAGRPAFGAAREGATGIDGTDPEAQALAVAAASGIGADGGPLLLLGDARRLAALLKGLLPPASELVLASEAAPSERIDGSVVRVGSEIPFFDDTFAGAVVSDAEASQGVLRECARLVKRSHRVVVLDPAPDAQARLGACGLMRFVGGSGVVAAGR